MRKFCSFEDINQVTNDQRCQLSAALRLVNIDDYPFQSQYFPVGLETDIPSPFHTYKMHPCRFHFTTAMMLIAGKSDGGNWQSPSLDIISRRRVYRASISNYTYKLARSVPTQLILLVRPVVYCRDNNNDNDIRLLRVMQAAPVGSSSSSYNSMGSADDDYGEQNVMDVDKSTSTSTDDCVIPCGHIYDPVCAVEEDTIVGGGGDNAIEVREFPNECSMHRSNCEWHKSTYSADCR